MEEEEEEGWGGGVWSVVMDLVIKLVGYEKGIRYRGVGRRNRDILIMSLLTNLFGEKGRLFIVGCRNFNFFRFGATCIIS